MFVAAFILLLLFGAPVIVEFGFVWLADDGEDDEFIRIKDDDGYTDFVGFLPQLLLLLVLLLVILVIFLVLLVCKSNELAADIIVCVQVFGQIDIVVKVIWLLLLPLLLLLVLVRVLLLFRVDAVLLSTKLQLAIGVIVCPLKFFAVGESRSLLEIIFVFTIFELSCFKEGELFGRWNCRVVVVFIGLVVGFAFVICVHNLSGLVSHELIGFSMLACFMLILLFKSFICFCCGWSVKLRMLVFEDTVLSFWDAELRVTINGIDRFSKPNFLRMFDVFIIFVFCVFTFVFCVKAVVDAGAIVETTLVTWGFSTWLIIDSLGLAWINLLSVLDANEGAIDIADKLVGNIGLTWIVELGASVVKTADEDVLDELALFLACFLGFSELFCAIFCTFPSFIEFCNELSDVFTVETVVVVTFVVVLLLFVFRLLVTVFVALTVAFVDWFRDVKLLDADRGDAEPI